VQSLVPAGGCIFATILWIADLLVGVIIKTGRRDGLLMKGENKSMTYHLPHTKELCDAALGIVYARKLFPKSDKPIRTVRSYAKACAFRAPIGAILALPFFLLMHDSPTQSYRTFLSVCAAVMLITALIHAVSALLFYQTFHTYFSVFKAKDSTGESFLSVDETGICDADQYGNESKFVWSNYESTVITKEVIILFRRDNIYHLLPYTKELSRDLTEALVEQGKGDTIYHRTIKQ
jgi:hypothetical protein